MKRSAILLFIICMILTSCGGSSPTTPPPPTTQYTLTVQISPTGAGTVAKSPNQTQYASGTQVSLMATAAANYTFSNWTGDATGTANPTTVTMNGNKTVTANFTGQYTLTVAVSPTGAGAVALSPSGGTYAAGTVVTLTATAISGYVFDHWSGDASGNNPSTTVTMNGNKSVTANYTAQYTLTVQVSPAGAGTVDVSPNQTQYKSGTVVTLTATALAGYAFVNWAGDTTGTANPTTVTMNGNKTITAVFIALYTLTVQVTPPGAGTVALSPNQTQYASGTVVTLTVTAAAGYDFDFWTGDLTGNTNPATIKMNGDKTVTAKFGIIVRPSPTNGETVPKFSGQTQYGPPSANQLGEAGCPVAPPSPRRIARR